MDLQEGSKFTQVPVDQIAKTRRGCVTLGLIKGCLWLKVEIFVKSTDTHMIWSTEILAKLECWKSHDHC